MSVAELRHAGQEHPLDREVRRQIAQALQRIDEFQPRGLRQARRLTVALPPHAVQASSALPGLYPPVEIEGRHYVDGVLLKTLHASVALEAGAELVLCINPIVPVDTVHAVEEGMMERVPYQDNPPRYEYVLTDSGHDLMPSLVALLDWGQAHASTTRPSRLRLTHADCGEQVRTELRCAAGHEVAEEELVVTGRR